MHPTIPAITLCAAVLGGCSPGQAPGPSPSPADPASPDVAVPRVWQARLTTQFLGTVPGPLQDVSIDSAGPVKVTVDGKVVGQSTLSGAELEPLARLLAAPGLAAAKTDDHPGQQAHLVVTGDVQLDVTGPGEAMAPVLAEIDRLRDLVGPPEDFQIVAAGGDTEILLSSNGYTEVKRSGAVIKHNLPHAALTRVRALLSITALRDPRTWTAPTGTANLAITGDINVRGVVDMMVAGPAPALFAESMRLAAVVAAKEQRPTNFEAVFTAQLHGAGLGPLRTITVRSSDRHIVLVDDNPDVQESDRPLKDEEWTALVDMLVDPSFRLAEGTPPSGEGLVYRVKITGDQPMDATYRGEPPQALVQLLNRLDWLARHY